MPIKNFFGLTKKRKLKLPVQKTKKITLKETQRKRNNKIKPERIVSRKIKGIDGAKFRSTEKGRKILRKHPFVYQVVNEIVSDHLRGLNLLNPKIKTKRIQNHEIVKTIKEFKQTESFKQKTPFFRIANKINFGKYIIERVLPEFGLNNIGMFRVTSNKGESALIKIERQNIATSKMKDMQIARELGFKTPDYFLEFHFPEFNVQVMEAMNLPNLKQLKKSNPLLYKFAKRKFNSESRKLGNKKFLDAGEENCLVLIRKGKLKLPKIYLYWIDLI